MHFIGFNIIPRRIPDYLDSIHTWNLLSSISSISTLTSLLILYLLGIIWPISVSIFYYSYYYNSNI
jgi:heme/copper-type cytochrome/quinol oxidase subunit 1